MDPKKLDELAEKVAKLIPPGLSQLQADIQKDVKAVVQSALAKLDLVTREEFDVQTKVLHRLEQQLAELDKQIKSMEKKLTPAKPKSPPKKQ